MSTTPHAKRSHARLSPSKAATWAVCTASTAFIEENAHRIPPQKSSPHADEGTTAHEVAESLLTNNPKKMPKKGVDKRMLDHCRKYVKWVNNLGLKVVVEARVPLWYDPSGPNDGHVDVLAYSEDEMGDPVEVYVIDFKYGQGVKVEAKDNLQTAIYAIGSIRSRWEDVIPDNLKILLTIYQPRCQKDEGEEAWSTWVTTWSELDLFVTKNVEVPAANILNPKAKHLLKFVPNHKSCHWCPAKNICTARTEWLMDGSPVQAIVNGNDTPSATALSDAQIVNLMQKEKEIVKFLASAKEYAAERYNMGKPIAGTKMVTGRGTRSWSDTQKVQSILAHEIQLHSSEWLTEPQLKSVAQIEELLEDKVAFKEITPKQAALLAPYIIRVPGAPVITTEDDKRTEIRAVDPTQVFDLIEEGNPWD